MKKITTLFAVAALSFTFAATGCKKKAADGDKDPSGKVEDKGSDTMTKPADGSAMAKPADGSAAAKPADGSAAAPAAGGGASDPACADYKAAVDKMGACDKPAMKATADAMKTTYEST